MIAPFCVTIDCDGLHEHHAVWGLPAPTDLEAGAFYQRSLEEAAAWLQDRGLPATFFITGSRVPEESLPLLLQLHGSGNELGNHTWSHPYDLSHRDEVSVRDEIRQNHRWLAGHGVRCAGFRAPGYHLPRFAVPALDELGYRYSSSQITGWVYPAAKWAASLALRMKGRTTNTVRHPTTDIWTPPAPYHPDQAAPHRPGNSPIWEIPIAASRWGLPNVGPLIHACPFPFLFDTPVSRPWILNLHLTDFTPGTSSTPLAHQDFMLRIPLVRRLTALDRIIDRARAQNRPFLTMAAAVQRLPA
ncbi:polysaccharide deacetylase family protein [Myxococcota bacterium]|nr:polysaccharide deacetylase family protein [Myxococcota bacterium]MBU1413776.1 polysaccharide deacetylase family protein [Myxococcota bacterium]MBU1511360.1 polysaccharide deacetylase family protein [Myxococcota bacterium]